MMTIEKARKVCYIFGTIMRYVLGCIFLYGSLSKLRQPYGFLGNVYSYELVGPKMGVFVAITLPWAEFLTGICLLCTIFTSGALLMSTCLGATFVFVLSWAIYYGLDISCGCFGADLDQIGYGTLIRSVVIVFISLLAFFLHRFSYPIPALSR